MNTPCPIDDAITRILDLLKLVYYILRIIIRMV